MKKIIILCFLLLTVFGFSDVYEKKNVENVETELTLRKKDRESYDFLVDYVVDSYSDRPKLRQIAGTAVKEGNSYVYVTDYNGKLIFNIKKDSVLVKTVGVGSENIFISGTYKFKSKLTNEDSEFLDRALLDMN